MGSSSPAGTSEHESALMAATPPSLADADWLRAPSVRAVFAALDGEAGSARIVGGAVRDALAGLPVGDVDFATPLTPDAVVERVETAGLKAVPTGIEHGTVTVVANRTGYQVTTLREDIETDGRHAVVRFGDDWTADARRRDFTVNALSVDAAGLVDDPLGGYPDILARVVRFIGDAGRRIAEDHLRILRFFRFNAQFGVGPVDPGGLDAAIRARNDLRDLSAERIGHEMRRLVLGPRAAEIAGTMQDAGILGIVLGGVGYIGTLRRVADFTPQSDAALRFAALGCRAEPDVERLADRLRLSNAVRDGMDAALVGALALPPVPSERDAKHRLYAIGASTWRAAVTLAYAWRTGSADEAYWRALYTLPERWTPPRFPLTGKDVLGAGASRGPAVGGVLKALEAWWVDKDFVPDESTLRARLQQMVAATQ